MIDSGRWNACSKVTSYVAGLAVDHLDYHFATHYDADHIGCLDDLVSAGLSLGACYDRGGAGDTQTYATYAATCGAARHTATKGQTFDLGGGASIEIVDLNGAGISTSDENALGMVLKLIYGSFDHVFPGDLEGTSPNVESVVGPEVGDVDVCKVTHHGSEFSNTDAWLNAISPEVCVLSVGNNSYDHPTAEALERLHGHGVYLYWTSTGSGPVSDPSWDTVAGGSITIAVSPNEDQYTVAGPGFSDTYQSD